VANALVLAVLSGWVLHVTLDSGPSRSTVSVAEVAVDTPSPTASAAASPPPVLTKQQVLRSGRQQFGVSYAEAPFDKAGFAGIARNAGARPTMVEYFVKWTEQFRPVAAEACYQKGALPVVAWEPWAGDELGADQPKYALAKIAGGAHDGYVTRFATAVKNYRAPIVLRFAHEMNGAWYPWSEKNSGNKAGDYIRAWRHVHDVFRRVGATNVIWVWSPNVVNSLPDVPLEPFYPGDSYVDWVGVVGYYETGSERTFATLFGPTRTAVRAFSRKPVLILETAVESGARKAKDIADLFAGVAASPDVVGFTWFNYVRRADWRVDSDPSALDRFRASAQNDRFGFDVRKP